MQLLLHFQREPQLQPTHGSVGGASRKSATFDSMALWPHRRADQVYSGYFLLENRERSRFWDEEEIRKLPDLPQVELTTADGGALGAVDKDGFPSPRPIGSC